MSRPGQMEWYDLFQVHPRPGITIPSRGYPFGFSVNRNGGMLHHVTRVAIRWEAGQPAQIGAVWGCNRSDGSLNVRLVDDPAGYRWCPRCDIGNVQNAPQVVYVGTMPDGRVKVGTTKRLAVRRRQLQLDVLGFCPGGYPEEMALLARMGTPVEGREWFAPGAERIALAWMAEQKAQAA